MLSFTFLGVDSSLQLYRYLLGCTWTAIPMLVHAKMINNTVRSLASKNVTAVLAPVGSAVLLSVQGMAQAILLGARLNQDYGSMANWYIPNPNPYPAEVFQTLLTNGIKGTLTGYTGYFISLFCQVEASDELSPYSLLTVSMTVGLKMFIVNLIFWRHVFTIVCFPPTSRIFCEEQIQQKMDHRCINPVYPRS